MIHRIRKKLGTTARYRAKRRRAGRKIVYSIRAQVVRRAEGCCERCGRGCLHSGEAHHKIHRSQGGQWTMENIEFLCPTCHGTAHGVKR